MVDLTEEDDDNESNSDAIVVGETPSKRGATDSTVAPRAYKYCCTHFAYC